MTAKELHNKLKNGPLSHDEKKGAALLKSSGFESSRTGTWGGISSDGTYMQWVYSPAHGWTLPNSWQAKPGQWYGAPGHRVKWENGKVVRESTEDRSSVVSLSQILTERVDTARSPRLDGSTRRKANKALEKAGMDGNGRFASVSQALGVIWNTLSDFGLEPDEVVSPIIRGDEGRFTQRIARKNESDAFSPIEIRNSMLAVFWTRLDSNKYEIVAYLS